MTYIKLALAAPELEALYDVLNEERMRMDDDGNEGAFAASPLQAIQRKIIAARRAAFWRAIDSGCQ